MFRAQGFATSRSPRHAEVVPGRVEGGDTRLDPTARIRRRNHCKICGRLMPDERVFCSYCVQYVH